MRIDKKGKPKLDKAFFHSKTYIYINFKDENIKKMLDDMQETILNAITNHQSKGSGWYFDEVLRLEINTVKYRPLKGSSYVPLPDNISTKKAIIFIQNKKDNKCFMWSILRYFHIEGVHDPQRLTDFKQYENDLNFKNISFPVKIKDIFKFEKQNPNIPPINVFSLNDKNKVFALRLND